MKESSTFSSRLKIFWQIIEGFEDWSTLIAFIIITGLVNLAIILRITINYESSEWDEIARFTAIWMYMIAIAIASKEDSHLRAGLINLKSAIAKQILEILFNLIGLICTIVFAWWSIIQLKWIIRTNQTSLVLMLNMWLVYLSFVVGSILAAIHNLNHLIKQINKFKNLREEELK
jgi:TRAP-type C4-dicarboxylate transport system permease small subunit